VLPARLPFLPSSRTEDDSELNIDAGLLTVFDPTPIDEEEYKYVPMGALGYPIFMVHLDMSPWASCADPSSCTPSPRRLDTEAYLTSHALPPLQALLNTLFSLPTARTSSGPLATLPAPTTMLPREKPLPKPKPLTKWERFANAKGISHSKKDKNVWDEDRQEFVARWGRDGLNKKVEEQWITEVKVRPGKSPRPHTTTRIATMWRADLPPYLRRRHRGRPGRHRQGGPQGARRKERQAAGGQHQGGGQAGRPGASDDGGLCRRSAGGRLEAGAGVNLGGLGPGRGPQQGRSQG
jgi:hypothetical protein